MLEFCFVCFLLGIPCCIYTLKECDKMIEPYMGMLDELCVIGGVTVSIMGLIAFPIMSVICFVALIVKYFIL